MKSIKRPKNTQNLKILNITKNMTSNQRNCTFTLDILRKVNNSGTSIVKRDICFPSKPTAIAGLQKKERTKKNQIEFREWNWNKKEEQKGIYKSERRNQVLWLEMGLIIFTLIEM